MGLLLMFHSWIKCVLTRVYCCVRLFATLWTVRLSMEFSRQEYWSGLPFPTPEAQTHISCVSCIGRQILHHCATWIKCGIVVDMQELLFTRLAKYSSIPRFLPFLMSEMNIEFCENLFWYLIIVFPL